MELDPDIDALELTEPEKHGVQLYRNYKAAFEQKAVEIFVEDANKEKHDVAGLEAVVGMLCSEDPRFLPVIFCSFVDEQLAEMFLREIPEGVPGGKKDMLRGSFGPLSSLAQRVQIAYAFGWMHRDLLIELDRQRKMRNDVSHKWDMAAVKERLNTLITKEMDRFEEFLGDGDKLPEKFWEGADPITLYRIRLIWLAGRCFYESKLFPSAVRQRLVPQQALYGKHQTNLLVAVATLCVKAVKAVLRAAI